MSDRKCPNCGSTTVSFLTTIDGPDFTELCDLYQCLDCKSTFKEDCRPKLATVDPRGKEVPIK